MKYIAYPKAYDLLKKRLSTTPEEIAAWVFLGEENGGLDAYVQVDEKGKAPRFSFALFEGDPDYVSALSHCWFLKQDILLFDPGEDERFVTGQALLERWRDLPGISVEKYIIVKIQESKLLDLHPTQGGIADAEVDYEGLPSVADCLFSLGHITNIEKEEFSLSNTVMPDERIQATELIPYPPVRQDDWYFVIRDMVAEFFQEEGRCPSRQEAWARLRSKPPHGYVITSETKRGEQSLLMDGKPFYLGAFKDRWKRYFGKEGGNRK